MSGTLEQFHWTVQAVFDAFPNDALRWEALGQQDSDIHRAYGRECDALIKAGVPNMIAYKAIGKKAGKGEQSIRKAYYVFLTFPDCVWEQYSLAPYSAFRHARQCDDPEKVLEYYIEKNCSIDELEAVFPVSETSDERETFENTGFERYFYGAYREMLGLSKEKYKRCEALLKEFQQIVKGEK